MSTSKPPKPTAPPASGPPPASSPLLASSPPPEPSPPITLNNNRNTMERIVKYFEFNSCCFIIGLRTGSFIIGYLYLITNLATIPFTILNLIAAVAMCSGAVEIKDKTKEEVQDYGAFLLVFYAIAFVYLILFLAFNIMLLVGLHLKRRSYVKVYLTFTLIFIALSILTFFASFAGPVTVGGIVQNLFIILFSIYFFLVIRSYYLTMDSPANMPATNTA